MTSVALFTRAWIEIVLWILVVFNLRLSPSLRGRGLKFEDLKMRGQVLTGRPLYEGVD